jgi:hypothetical protein
MRDRVCREHELLVLDLCPSGRARSEGPLLVEEPRRAACARFELRFRSKVQARVRADRLVDESALADTDRAPESRCSRKEFRIFRVTSSWLGPVQYVENPN